MPSPLIEQLQRQAENESDAYRSLVLLGIAELSAKLDDEKNWIDQLLADADKTHTAMRERTEQVWQEVFGNGHGGLLGRTLRMEFYWRLVLWLAAPLVGALSIGLLSFLWSLLSGTLILTRVP